MSEQQCLVWRGQEMWEKLGHQSELKMMVMERGPLKVVFIRPNEARTETHERDEVYVVTVGTLSLTADGTRHRLNTGDAALVPAGVEHTFHELAGDVRLWSVRSRPAR